MLCCGVLWCDVLCCAVLVCNTCRPVHSTRTYTRDLVCDYQCPPVWSNDPTTHQAGLHSIPPPGSHITTHIQLTDVQGYDLDQLTLHSLPSILQRPRHRLRLDQIWSEGLGDQYKTPGAHTYTWSTLHDNPTPRHHYQPTPRAAQRDSYWPHGRPVRHTVTTAATTSRVTLPNRS